MWIPHGAVAVGFGLIALIALWRGIQFARGKREAEAPSRAADEGAQS
jgi:hypothetical protein